MRLYEWRRARCQLKLSVCQMRFEVRSAPSCPRYLYGRSFVRSGCRSQQGAGAAFWGLVSPGSRASSHLVEAPAVRELSWPYPQLSPKSQPNARQSRNQFVPHLLLLRTLKRRAEQEHEVYSSSASRSNAARSENEPVHGSHPLLMRTNLRMLGFGFRDSAQHRQINRSSHCFNRRHSDADNLRSACLRGTERDVQDRARLHQ